MERIIRDALVNHMTTNTLFCEEQHGFIKGKSCATQLLEYMEDLTAAIDQGYEVDVMVPGLLGPKPFRPGTPRPGRFGQFFNPGLLGHL